MNYLDKTMKLFQDAQWHSLDQIKEDIPIPENQLNEILFFLQEQSLIIKEGAKFRITPQGLKFLGLPV